MGDRRASRRAGALPEEIAEELDAVAEEQQEPEERRYPSKIGGAFYLAALARPALGNQPELLDGVALLAELGDRGVDPPPGEVVDLEALHDGPVAVGGGDGERRHEPFGDVVGAVRGDRHGDPVAVGGAEQPVMG